MAGYDTITSWDPVPAVDHLETIVAIDNRVPDSEFLLAALAVPAQTIRIGPDDDALSRILKTVRKSPGNRLVIICHGAPGALLLGEHTVTRDMLLTHRNTLSRIGRALRGAPISLYACSVAHGRDGRAFLAALASGTGCPVSASSLSVGDASKGGKWSLNTMVSTDPSRLPGRAEPSDAGPFDPDKLPAYQHLL
ncbi:DUF4347 domain-containing protein [Nisaea sp.]|uniref:DUF4347 domain-containing protein n=1 Tax=Nisaea sp. TaxID=2024842 RepID=UPI002B271C94|nr:DUF4347 domain-containing protein [Nisaea sp.]